MKEEAAKDGGPKYIRTLGSQSLSGINPLSSGGSSQVSMSHSPSILLEDPGSEDVRSVKRKSPSLLAGTPSQRPRLNTEVSEAGSYTSVNSAANSNLRVAQACDRCRSKKTRCDGKRPQCSQCAAVGFECRISDKLSRRAFPRGYTETLEERVRELEAENRRLVALCDIKEQQIHLVSHFPTNRKKIGGSDEQMLQELTGGNNGRLRVSSTNLFLLNKARVGKQPVAPSDGDHETKIDTLHDAAHTGKHQCDEVDCNNKLHSKPVSTNLNDPTAISFEQNEAPGLPAVKALTSMATREQSTQLATLVALSVPRSTEEILFIPQLLARIIQIHGFTSKQCLYSVSLLASLKSNLPGPQLVKWDQLDYLKTTNIWELDNLEKFFSETLKFDIFAHEAADDDDPLRLSITEIDELVSLYFESWSVHIPILDKEEFYSYYDKLKQDISTQPSLFQEGPSNFARRNKIISYKIFACILFTICQMGLLTKVKADKITNTDSKYVKLTSYYHRAISLIYLNPYFGMLTTSLQSLQLLSLLLFYFLNTGNVSAIYELRGRVVSMAQQLRLHRCPSAVLGGSGSTMNKREQGDRRVLFWGIYYLDVFSALQLGVPRLIKDFEIECALPVAENDDKEVSLAGQMIRLEGRVSQFSLAIIRFAKVLGNILDTVFKRGMTESVSKKLALIHENALDNWRRGLPFELTFEIDVNGTINMDKFNEMKQSNTTVDSMEQMVLLVFYFLAKCMIHLPVVATRPLPSNEDPNSDLKEEDENELDKDKNGASTSAVRSSSSYILLQQATNTMLNVLESLKSIYLPLPLNVARTKARFTILSARGSLEYIKGGALFLDNKALLLDVVKSIEGDRKLELPGVISWHSLKLLDMTISLLLQPPNTKVEKLDKLLKKKLNYYSRMMGRPFLKTSSTRPEMNGKRKNSSDDKLSRSGTEENFRATNLTPISSKSDGSPEEKRIKLEDESSEVSNALADSSYTEDPVSSTNHPIVPASTQTAIAEALHLDPVLNRNILSVTDLAAFFGGNLPAAPENTQSSPSHQTHSDLKHSRKDRGPAAGSNLAHRGPLAKGPTTGIDGLFRVPSNADFLMDEYYPSGNSHINLALFNNGGSHDNAFGTGPSHASNTGSNPAFGTSAGQQSSMNYNHLADFNDRSEAGQMGFNHNGNMNNVSDFNFAVDASLGLAPLLDWSPEMHAHDGAHKTASHPSDRSGMILDTSLQPSEHPLSSAQPDHVVKNHALPVPTLASNGHRRPVPPNQHHQHASGADSNEDSNAPMLTLGSRRGPRRRRNMAYDPNLNGNGAPGTQAAHKTNLSNLFQWQNSK